MLKSKLSRLLVFLIAVLVFTLRTVMAAETSRLLHVFADYPECGLLQTPCFPTPNDKLDSISRYAARIRTNDQYGMPGWTRDLGNRFHKGVDIVPIHFEKTEKMVKIDYYDPRSKKSFVEYEKVLVPKDEVYSVLDGIVLVANKEEQRSGYGRYVMVQHKFADGTPFLSMYAHLRQVDVKEGDKVLRGDHIAWMGNSSSNEGGRNYLKFVPHCHFEIGRIIDNRFSSSKLAKVLYPRIVGGNADPRNVQPYDPIEFLKIYKAENRSEFVAAKKEE